MPHKRVIALAGGKGGVGTSTIAANLAVSFAASHRSVVLVDGDTGMADLNLLMGVAPERSLLDVLNGAPPHEALVSAHGVHLLPGLNGSYALQNMSRQARQLVIHMLAELSRTFDTLVVDVGSGIGANQGTWAAAADDVVVVTSPEALSISGAYACLKVLATEHGVRRAFVLPNRVAHSREGAAVFERLTGLVEQFFEIELIALPAIPIDPCVGVAAERGVPATRRFPNTAASRAVLDIIRTLDGIEPGPGMNRSDCQ